MLRKKVLFCHSGLSGILLICPFSEGFPWSRISRDRLCCACGNDNKEEFTDSEFLAASENGLQTGCQQRFGCFCITNLCNCKVYFHAPKSTPEGTMKTQNNKWDFKVEGANYMAIKRAVQIGLKKLDGNCLDNPMERGIVLKRILREIRQFLDENQSSHKHW